MNLKFPSLAFAALIFAFANVVASAATFTVTNTNDSGPGSLRHAVADANFNGLADTIVFDATVFAAPQTIVLTSGEIVIEKDGADGWRFQWRRQK